jgi:hypothetical protein
MIHARIDIELRDHPKAAKAGSAMYLWTWAMLWAKAKQEDGVVPTATLLGCPWGSTQANRGAIDRLRRAGLFEPDGTISADGVRAEVIHNYLNKNESRDDTRTRLDAHAEAQKRYRSKASRPTPGDASRASHVIISPATAPAPASAVVNLEARESREGGVQRGESDNPRSPSSLTETDPPETLAVTPAIVAQCTFAGAPTPEPEHVVQFLANARQKGQRARDWGSGLVQWMIREKRYGTTGRRPKSEEVTPQPAYGRSVHDEPPRTPEQLAEEQRCIDEFNAKHESPKPESAPRLIAARSHPGPLPTITKPLSNAEREARRLDGVRKAAALESQWAEDEAAHG